MGRASDDERLKVGEERGETATERALRQVRLATQTLEHFAERYTMLPTIKDYQITLLHLHAAERALSHAVEGRPAGHKGRV